MCRPVVDRQRFEPGGAKGLASRLQSRVTLVDRLRRVTGLARMGCSQHRLDPGIRRRHQKAIRDFRFSVHCPCELDRGCLVEKLLEQPAARQLEHLVDL